MAAHGVPETISISSEQVATTTGVGGADGMGDLPGVGPESLAETLPGGDQIPAPGYRAGRRPPPTVLYVRRCGFRRALVEAVGAWANARGVVSYDRPPRPTRSIWP